MTTKPQHEQDYEQARAGIDCTDPYTCVGALASLASLRDEAAKVPGLEAQCASLKESVSNLRSERDTLRERVATLEAERVTAGETESDLRRAVEHLQCTLEGAAEGTAGWEWNLVTAGVARAESAEARVKELSEAIHVELGKCCGEAMPDGCGTCKRLSAALDAQPPPAPAQGMKCRQCKGSGTDVDTDEEGGTQNERHVPCSRCKGSGQAPTPTPPALMEAVGANTERSVVRKLADYTRHRADCNPTRSTSDGACTCGLDDTRNAALAAYDAAKGGGR